ncbi:MAG: tRNA uracil 4-sulfurtransferase ThiI [Candidatus Micrarchaeia archaeon]
MENMIIIRFGELWLKGANRDQFVDRLMSNIKAALKGEKYSELKNEYDRFVLYASKESDMKGIEAKLAKVPGISNIAHGTVAKNDIKDMIEKAKLLNADKKSVRIEAHRSYKTDAFTSRDIISGFIKATDLGFSLDMESSNKIYISVSKDRTFIYMDKVKGIGGLPVGASGKAIVLLSGGIDSPVASYYAMKRGLQPIYLHVHTFPSNKAAMQSKIPKIISVLSQFSPQSRSYYAPAHIFQSAVAGMPTKYELVLFKKFMYKLAERIAKDEGAKAIVTGESLGQVASQTVENLTASQHGVSTLIVRPLIGMNKEEIIGNANKIGTYGLSIQEYRDVCSIKIRSPATKAKPVIISKLYDEYNLQDALDMTYEKTSTA